MNIQGDTLPHLSFDYVKAAKRSRSVLASLNEEQIETLAAGYRRFLLLKSKYPTLAVAPIEIIDEMWHLHMLHPRAYYDDCMKVFGQILDHSPGFGSGDGEYSRLTQVFDRTGELWMREFGEPYCLPNLPFQNLIVCADEEEDQPDQPAKPADPKPGPDSAPGSRRVH